MSKMKKRGRPARNEAIVKMCLRKSVYNLWKEKKFNMGYAKATNSEFAEVLLNSVEIRNKNTGVSPSKRSLSFSSDDLPSLAIKRRPQFKLASSPNKEKRLEAHTTMDEMMEVDVTGVSSLEGTVSFSKCLSVNPNFASFAGKPLQPEDSRESDTDSSEESGCSSDKGCKVFSRPSMILNESRDSCETDCDENSDVDILSIDKEEDDDGIMTTECGPKKTTLTATRVSQDISVDISLQESSCKKIVYPSMTSTPGVSAQCVTIPDASPSTSSAKNPLDNCTTVPCHVQNPVDDHDPSLPTSEEKDTSTNDICENIKQAFDDLLKRQSAESFDQMAKQEKVIVTLDKLLSLFTGTCNEKKCGREKRVWHTFQGSVLIMGWNCGAGHGGVWESSDVLIQKERGPKVYVNNVVLAASVILSGNIFSKIALFMNCLNLHFISNTSFCRTQRLHVLPTVQTFWSDMKEVIDFIIKEKKVVLSGDGSNDSSGFCAQHCVSSLMESITKIIVDLEVKEKPEAGGTSTVIEVAVLKCLLEQLIQTISIEELTTDSSSSVIGMVKKLKDIYPVLATLKHSLDVWHKSCKLTEVLTQAAKVKNCEDIVEWIEPICNHFWHVCQSCDKDEKKLKDAWVGVAHHVVGEHVWATGQCSHGPLTSSEVGKSYLLKGSKAAEAVRKIIFDEEWLKSLVYYNTFRNTGASDLENFNSMMLKYAPKRNSFEYLVFVAQVTLAAIDDNMLLFRPQATTKDGHLKFAHKYSQHTKKWHAEPVKIPQDYKYMPYLLSQILSCRYSDRMSVRRRVSPPASHPKNLAPTIAMKQPTATSELVKYRLAR